MKEDAGDEQVAGTMSMAPVDEEVADFDDSDSGKRTAPARLGDGLLVADDSWSNRSLVRLSCADRLARYPSSFLNSRLSVDMSTCSSPNVFKTLQKSPSKKGHSSEGSSVDSKVAETIRELDERRKMCERDGNYIEANSAAEELLRLKVEMDAKRRGAMLERHMRERGMARKSYLQELNERSQLWDRKLKKFHGEVMEHAAELKRQHMASLHALKAKMMSKTPSKPQWSSELLKLRKVQECLGKQCKYVDAQELKRQGDQMEQYELQATIQAYQNEIASKENAMRCKQQVELEVLLQRAAQARDELRRKKEQDLERCRQRHKNVARELKVLHTQESFRFDQHKRAAEDNKRAVRRRPSTAVV